MSPPDAPASGSARAVPPCLKCQANTVRPLLLDWVAEGVQYWACRRCGVVWATCDGEDLRTIAAKGSQRRSA